MTPLYGHSDAVAEFVAANIPGCSRGFGLCKAIGVVSDDGVLVAGVVYHRWDPDCGVIEMSGASKSRRWLTRPVLQAIFKYPFTDLGCQMVIMRVSERNTHLHRILKAYGFTGYLIPRLQGRDENEIVFTLTDDAWISNKFNKGLRNG